MALPARSLISLSLAALVAACSASTTDDMLIRKLTNQLAAGEGNPMPQGEGIMWTEPAYVPDVRAWIAAGAPQN